MALFSGTYSWGHEGEIQVYGPLKNRQWIADRKFEGVCPDCYEKKKEEEEERKERKIIEEIGEKGWPKLSGTPKQVAWANILRPELPS